MMHARNLVLKVVFVSGFVLLCGFVGVRSVTAQDTVRSKAPGAIRATPPPDTGVNPDSRVPDSVAAAEIIGRPKSESASKPVRDTAAAAKDTVVQKPSPKAAQTSGQRPAPANDTGVTAVQEAPSPAESEIKVEDVIPVKDTGAVAVPSDTGQAMTPATDTSVAVEEDEPEDPTAPYKNIVFAEDEKPVVVIETSMGKFSVQLWPDLALKHCQSFVYLANKGFYDSLTIHRVVPGFIIQGGCPNGNGTGGPGYTLPQEFSDTPHEDGILSAARLDDDVNSAGSQFFICVGRAPSLDGKYTVFGKVIEGLSVVHKISKVPAQAERPKTPVVMTSVHLREKDK